MQMATARAVRCETCKTVLCVVKVKARIDGAYCERCHELFQGGMQTSIQQIDEQLGFLRSWHPSAMMKPHADVALQASDGRFVHAHKAVLMGKSNVFKAMFMSQMKENYDGVVKVEDMTYDELDKFVHYLYTATVSNHELEKHSVALLQAAEKYHIKPLKLVCEEYLAKHVTGENVCNVLELACTFDSKIMRESVLGQVLSKEFLRDNMLGTIIKSYKEVSTFEGYKSYNEKHPQLITELFEDLVKRLPDEIDDKIIG